MNSFKLNRIQINLIVVVMLLMAVTGLVGYRLGQTQGSSQSASLPNFKLLNTGKPTEFKEVDFGKFWEVWQILERDYLDQDKLDKAKMVDGAIEGMTAALDDPYTVYLAPIDQQRSEEDLKGSFYGVGIQLGYVDEILAVMSPLKGTPAEEAGLRAGDLILHVKDPSKNLDSDTAGWSLSEAVEHIRGEKGTKVELTLYRKEENKQFDVSLERGEIVVPSAEVEFVEYGGKRVAHLTMSRFGDRTTEELDQSITKILAERNSIAGVVFDLRNNPGGYFEGAIEVASEFLNPGQVVVSQQGKASKKDFKADGEARLANIPVVLLVNKGSASASEIVAGAMRDQRKIKLVGEKTFGKGTVQDARELDNGGGLHVTVARWLLPAGSWIHKEGIPVDVEVKDNPDTEEDEMLQQAIQAL